MKKIINAAAIILGIGILAGTIHSAGHRKGLEDAEYARGRESLEEKCADMMGHVFRSPEDEEGRSTWSCSILFMRVRAAGPGAMSDEDLKLGGAAAEPERRK